MLENATDVKSGKDFRATIKTMTSSNPRIFVGVISPRINFVFASPRPALVINRLRVQSLYSLSSPTLRIISVFRAFKLY